jgi:hypothetical protein
MAYKTQNLGWTRLSAPQQPVRVLDEEQVIAAASAIALEDRSTWQSVAVAPTGLTTAVTWYVAGTLPNSDSKPLALVLLLEENNPLEAIAIGSSILQAATIP